MHGLMALEMYGDLRGLIHGPATNSYDEIHDLVVASASAVKKSGRRGDRTVPKN